MTKTAYKQVIVMRKDLNMRKGKAIAQGCHASVRAVLKSQHTVATRSWLKGGEAKICVCVNSEEELRQIYSQAVMKGLTCSLVEDSGRTEFHGVPTLTCCAIGPNTPEEIDDITGGLTLW
jgi:peptidyl-tRNA hydrolase, PTH2 family